MRDAEKWLRERVEKMIAVYEIDGRAGLKQYGETDVGLLSMALSQDLRRVHERMENCPGNAVDCLRAEQLEFQVKDIAAELKERNREREMDR